MELENDTIRLLLGYENFYHTTSLENSVKIDLEGLLPNKYPDFQYLSFAPRKDAFICLCPYAKLEGWKSTLRDMHNDIVVYSIKAEDIVKMDIGFDWTMQGIHTIIDKPQPIQFEQSLKKLGTIVSFQHIPPNLLNKL